MSPETRFRLVTSLGLGVVFGVGGAIVAYLLVQSAGLFGWPVIAAIVGLGAVTSILLDLVTTRPQ